MKTYRLKNDANWNYGIRFYDSPFIYKGKCVDIFCFKKSTLEEHQQAPVIKKGFWITFEFLFTINIQKSFRIYKR